MEEGSTATASVAWIPILIGSAIGSVILSIVANLLTPVARDWYLRLSPFTKQKKIESIKKELEIITKLHDNHDLLSTDTYESLAYSLQLITSGIIFVALSGGSMIE